MESEAEVDKGKYLEDFFIAFAALISRMAQLDCQTLEENFENANVLPDLVSHPYLKCFSWFLGATHLWKLLEVTYGYPWKRLVAAIVNRFVQLPSQGIKVLTTFAGLLLQRPQSQPGLMANIWVPLSLVIRITAYSTMARGMDTDKSRMLWSGLPEVPNMALDFFKSIDSKLQRLIRKQVSTITLETSKTLVAELSTILYNILVADDHMAEVILPEERDSLQRMCAEDCTDLVGYVWKFRLFRKCIMEGRMEIRVQGVDTMQQELVNVYNKYIAHNKNRSDHKVVQFLSDFILNTCLIEYIVGVESHPQLIARSSNIVGFLVVTGKYTEGNTDAIWKAVTSSQDARTIDAILSMLSGIFNIATYPLMLYLCDKLNELPTSSFDNKMIHYSKNVLDNVIDKWEKLQSNNKLDMPPYHLCIRLIRQATSDTSLPADRKRDVHHFALQELYKLTLCGPSDADRSSIYDQCISDILAKTPFASGSISAVIALLRRFPANDIKILATKSNFTDLVIDEFSQFRSVQCADYHNSYDPLSIRLDLLQQIVIHIPDSITFDLGQALWDRALGDQAETDQTRDAAWGMLVRAIHDSPPKNTFIDRCIQNYLPQLNPHLFTTGMLSFAQSVIQYEWQSADSMSPNDKEEYTTPGGELLWHLALVSPYDTIEVKAIQMLVSLYLEGPGIRRASRDLIAATHTRLVERCIYQLTKAASKLKNYQDGTSSGEDESMVIVASEDDIKAEKMCFSRSLRVLKVFLDDIRSRPQLSPSLKKHEPARTEPMLKGKKSTIRYQPFIGGSSPGIQTIEVGDLDTVEDLVINLVDLTGFNKFSAIAGGQKLDLASCSDSTIRDIKLEQKGLLIIRKSPDAEVFVGSASLKGLRSLEIEVMKHFDELYGLLGMEDILGKDVSSLA